MYLTYFFRCPIYPPLQPISKTIYFCLGMLFMCSTIIYGLIVSCLELEQELEKECIIMIEIGCD